MSYSSEVIEYQTVARRIHWGAVVIDEDLLWTDLKSQFITSHTERRASSGRILISKLVFDSRRCFSCLRVTFVLIEGLLACLGPTPCQTRSVRKPTVTEEAAVLTIRGPGAN